MLNNKIVLIIALSFFYLSSLAQNFIISDVISNDISYDELQEEKLNSLGTKVKMNIYDTSIILTITDKNGRIEETVFDKTSAQNVYINKARNHTTTMTLEKTFAYINSVKIVTVHKDKKKLSFILKRE